MKPLRKSLETVAYGERLEGVHRRSLGFGLLKPVEVRPWTAEVERLARLLQSVTYPEGWPSIDLFATVILGTGDRLVSVVRYGLTDSTAGKRIGGLELVGVILPRRTDLAFGVAAISILRGREWSDDGAASAIPSQWEVEIGEGLTAVKTRSREVSIRSADTPTQPDEGIEPSRILASGGQHLPFAPGDFPWDEYGARGSVTAWLTPGLSLMVRFEASRRSWWRRLWG